jgi:hypothetical protein
MGQSFFTAGKHILFSSGEGYWATESCAFCQAPGVYISQVQEIRQLCLNLLERKKDYIHLALRADETTMLSKPRKVPH